MIFEKTLGYDHAVVARSVANLAKLLEKKGDYDQADGLAGAFFQRTLATSKSAQGPHHADVARALADLARLRDKKGRYAEAEGMVRRALGISESALGAGHALTRQLRTELESLKLQASDYNASVVALSGSVGDDQISPQAALALPSIGGTASAGVKRLKKLETRDTFAEFVKGSREEEKNDRL